MNTAVQNLERLTRTYWQLSQSFNGRVSTEIPFTDAMSTCHTITYSLMPGRPLIKVVSQFKDALILGGLRPLAIQETGLIPLRRA
jgi:hypothetical protein